MPVQETIEKLREIQKVKGRYNRTVKAFAALIGLLGEYVSRDEQLDLVEALHPIVNNSKGAPPCPRARAESRSRG